MFGAAAASSSAASTGFGFGATSGASSAGASTGFGFGASKPGAGSSAASTGFGGFGAAASSAAASAPAASTGLSFGAAAGSAAGTAPAASSAGAAAAAAAAAAGHHASSAPAYRRFQRVAQQWDFASEHLQRTAPGAAGESALAKALAEALRANNRPAVPPNNHITQQRLAQLGFVHPAGGMMGGGMMAGGMMGGAMAAQRGSGVFHAVRAIFLARSAFACGLANPQITTVQLDDHVEEFGPAGPVFDWPIRPNTVTHYRHIL